MHAYIDAGTLVVLVQVLVCTNRSAGIDFVFGIRGTPLTLNAEGRI